MMIPQQKQKHGGGSSGGGGSGGGRGCSRSRVVKVAMGLLAACLGGYIVGPPLYWHVTEGLATLRRSSCPPCLCDCSSHPLLYLPEELKNAIFTDCMKQDHEVREEEGEKSFRDLLSEEMKLREAEALESQRRADMALLDAKKLTSQYQKEADKCNSGMETCEDAREKAEAALQAQRELSAMWELRARQRGWKGETTTTLRSPQNFLNGERMANEM